jgi:hypothetical protein
MLQQLIELLKIDDHYGISENIDIAKGKYKYETSTKKIYKQELRKSKLKKAKDGRG